MKNNNAKRTKRPFKKLTPKSLGSGGAATAGKKMLSRKERMAARMKQMGY